MGIILERNLVIYTDAPQYERAALGMFLGNTAQILKLVVAEYLVPGISHVIEVCAPCIKI